MTTDHRKALLGIKRFDQLIVYLRDELGWPISRDSFDDVDDLFYDFSAEELGIDPKTAAKIQEIKRLRPLSAKQPWGIFFVKFEPKKLPVVVLRKILSQVALKRRESANSPERAAWSADDLLFISNYGEGDERQISFAHFSQSSTLSDLPTLRVLGWNNLDTPLHLDAVAAELTQNLRWPDNDQDLNQWRQSWNRAFKLGHNEVINTAKVLSERLAELASSIRDRIKTTISIESENGSLTKLMKAFQSSLVHDLDVDGFADMYAQTIAYGLLSARITDPNKKTVDDFTSHMKTSPFLRELLETFLHIGGRKGRTGSVGIDFDELGVGDVIQLLDNSNMEAVILDFGDRNPQEDPVMHFFEGFLHAYDSKIRKDRGVFYTPQSVVSYIARSIHKLLQTELGLLDGLADTSTWGDMLIRIPNLQLPKLSDELNEDRFISTDEPFVQILDPATGTATFLVEVIDIIHKTLIKKWEGQHLSASQQITAWNDYVPTHLLPRLHAFELMMAPYAIAHMKIGLKLAETGYKFGSDERAHIYLTNALDPYQKQLKIPDFEALAHEASAVNEIKKLKCFTVVLGNPPYSLMSSNMEREHRALIEDYKFINKIKIHERSALQLEKNLNDDYVKFIRLTQLCIDRAGIGISGLITNHSFLDNPTMRGMRWSLMQSTSSIYMNDLHGNATKREDPPEGIEDSNVFQIKQGVAINLCVTNPAITKSCEVRHHECWGTRDAKEKWLKGNDVVTHKWHLIEPTPSLFLFVPQSSSLKAEFEVWDSLPEIMPINGAGYITARDNLVIDFKQEDLLKRIQDFSSSSLNDMSLLEKFSIADKKGWDIRRTRLELKNLDLEKKIIATNYRPFDNRWIFFDSSLVWGRSWPTMKHVVGYPGNLTMLATRMTKDQWDVWVSRTVSSHKAMSAYDTNSIFPLFLTQDLDDPQQSFIGEERINFSQIFLKKFASKLSLKQDGNQCLPQGIGAQEIFNYAYAIFRSPNYRSRYADFLKLDFPRLPLTGNLELFRTLSSLGAQLVSVQLLEVPMNDELPSSFIGKIPCEVEKISWINDTVWIDKKQTIGFEGVSSEIWNFNIGGYQVCEKWLKDRKGHFLYKKDVDHYRKIVVAISETKRIMAKIDLIIDRHGGWPGAFT
jgi:hypothetical protein